MFSEKWKTQSSTLFNMTNIIEVQKISKCYKIGSKQPYLTLRDSLMDLFKKTKKQSRREFWALKDISFTVKQGELLGVIGSNGAGKSTLLKILSRITSPTSGKAIVRGRVASLLEVGTGFSAELSGRENIFLNGSILGMTQREIKKKFDQIVSFAEVEKFIDTPVKHYSSGMYMRLAFSVAAHLEPDILLIDEVLAVGDAEFQKKCLAKMEDITKNEGRTVLFVSHNLVSVQKLCAKTILLNHGEIKKVGSTKNVIEAYLNTKSKLPGIENKIQNDQPSNISGIRFSSIKITSNKGSSSISANDGLIITLKYRSLLKRPITDVRIVITISNEQNNAIVYNFDSEVPKQTLNEYIPPEGKITCQTGPINLTTGRYVVDVFFHIQGTRVDQVTNAAVFEVANDISGFNYKKSPDSSVSNHLVKYTFQ